jgi:hypothetical protein
MRNEYKFQVGNKRKDLLRDTGIDGKKILKYALEEEYLKVVYRLN